LSGTGALFLAGYALKDIDSNPRDLLSTSPTWPNHELIFKSLGYPVKEILYYSKRRFDFDGYIAALESAQSGSVIVLHACAHNPTGCDPSQLQWKAIASVIRARNLFPIFDSAYLGFNSGNLDRDAWAIRYFVEDLGLEIGLCLSFAKNMGLYGTFCPC
jgi:aspartate aminotransferase